MVLNWHPTYETLYLFVICLLGTVVHFPMTVLYMSAFCSQTSPLQL